ncbi:MAG: addiction module toxin, HicA family [Chloroflexi bacterium]|nr:MAG: addiction module toxin, HicA family [Chloroflexota bacterium]
MPRLPRLSGSDLLRALQRACWHESRTRGSHVVLRHSSRPGRVVIPVHAGRTLKPKTLLAILDSAGITVNQLRDLL